MCVIALFELVGGMPLNTDLLRTERIKIAVQFFLTAICSFALGFVIPYVLSVEFYEGFSDRVASHFVSAFDCCADAYECAVCVLKYSAYDAISIAVIFLASFAAFNYALTNLALIYCGLRVGLAISFLSAFVGQTELDFLLDGVSYAVFVIFKVCVTALILYYAYSAALRSVSLRRTTPSGRTLSSSADVLKFLIYTFSCTAAALILTGLYCWLVYVFK